MVFFLFMKKRRSKVTNQLPDFADDTSGELSEKLGGFRKLFGAKTTGVGARDISGSNDLERQTNNLSAIPVAGYHQDSNDDFEYRGVTNSNNLDSVFRSSGNNTGQNSSSASTNQRSRFNSVYNPMLTMPEGGGPDPGPNDIFQSHEDSTSAPLPNFSIDTDHDRSSECEPDDELFNREAHGLLPSHGEEFSNNSRLRFREEI